MAKALSLIGISGSRVGQSTVFTGRSTTVGSDAGCDLVMNDRQLLPRHAELRVSLERWFILPLDPKAAIFVNGEPVRGQQRIDEGDLLTLGSATFKVTLGDTERAVGDRREEQAPEWGEERWRD
jgi:pSer/pThr/pTyr-binding forkhead associated (FHA) protein